MENLISFCKKRDEFIVKKLCNLDEIKKWMGLLIHFFDISVKRIGKEEDIFTGDGFYLIECDFKSDIGHTDEMTLIFSNKI